MKTLKNAFRIGRSKSNKEIIVEEEEVEPKFPSFKLREKSRLCWQVSDDKEKGARNTIQHPTDVHFLQDDQHVVVADSKGHQLLIYDKDGVKKSVFGKGTIWPNGVAVTRDGNIAVTDRKSEGIKIFDINTGQMVSRFGLAVGPYDEIKPRPSGIAVASNGNIITTDTCFNKINIFSQGGKLIKQFGKLGSSASELNLPFYCTVDKRDNIVVSDNRNFCVKVFDKSGNFRMKIGAGMEWGKRKFQCPYGVCLDIEGDILVSDYENNKVLKYCSTTGDFKGNIIDSCSNPIGLAMSTDGYLAMTEGDCDYTNVKMFDLYEINNNNLV